MHHVLSWSFASSYTREVVYVLKASDSNKVALVQVNVMLKDMPEEFGPRISIREYSFFDNPLMPKQVYISLSSITSLCSTNINVLLLFEQTSTKVHTCEYNPRSRIHGSTFIFVTREQKIAVYRTKQFDRAWWDFPNEATKKWYSTLFHFLILG